MAVLFLDLEATVIDDWSTRNLLMREIEIIRLAIDYRNAQTADKITALGLFSYAIYNKTDLEVFKFELQKPLEDALGVPFNLQYCLTVEDIGNFYKKVEKLHFNNYREFFDFCKNKAHTFFTVMKYAVPQTERSIFLIDDTVEDLDYKILRSNRTFSSRNIMDAVWTPKAAQNAISMFT